MADWRGRWYLVSMLGECHWVRNVRSAGGDAILHRRRSRPVRLTEVPIDERAPILRRYLQAVPGARPHVRVDRRRPARSFQLVAAEHPVFLVTFASDDAAGRPS